MTNRPIPMSQRGSGWFRGIGPNVCYWGGANLLRRRICIAAFETSACALAPRRVIPCPVERGIKQAIGSRGHLADE